MFGYFRGYLKNVTKERDNRDERNERYNREKLIWYFFVTVFCYPVTLLPCYPVTLLPCYLVTLSPSL
jgi:hypothetical protein